MPQPAANSPALPDAAASRAQLDRILASPGFQSADSLSRFLQFITEENLAGRGDEIKEYTLGVAVFDRGESFDPKVDTIVRVQARRLRAKLEKYYEEEGAADPVIIDLPKGTYNPSFRLAEPAPAARKVRRGTLWVAAAAALGIAAIAVGARFGRPKILPVTSIAVLPFDNLSHDPNQEWFSDGMTETLITELSKVHTLRVISRTSVMQYKGAKKPLKQIGQELGVDAVVEGSALKVGDHVRITAQLIAASTDSHLWGNDFDGELQDVLSLHRKVASAIAQQVGAVLSAADNQHLNTPAAPVNPQATAAYLQGLYLFDRTTKLEGALELAHEATREAPEMARAHVLVAYILLFQASYHQKRFADVLPEMHAELDRALAQEPDLGIGLSALGSAYLFGEHDWVRAESALRRAYEIDPSTGVNYAYLLAAQGHLPEAEKAAERSVQYDPANAVNLTDAARIHHFARHEEQAIPFFRKALELSPDLAYARAYLPASLIAAGHLDEVYEYFLTGSGLSESEKQEYGEAYRKDGLRGGYLYLAKNPRLGINGKLRLMVNLGRNAEALDLLEELERQVDSWMVQLEDPSFDPIRQEPRFKAIMKRVGYPEAMIR